MPARTMVSILCHAHVRSEHGHLRRVGCSTALQADGTTLNTGFFRSFLPGALRDLWGLTTKASLPQLQASGSYGTLAVTPASSGALLTVTNFHYSSPTFSIGAVPTAPTAPTATASSGAATVSWTAPTLDGSGPVTGYVLTATPASGGTPVTVRTSAGVTSATLSGPQAGPPARCASRPRTGPERVPAPQRSV